MHIDNQATKNHKTNGKFGFDDDDVKFEYTNSLDKEYDDVNKVVNCVSFNISRYGKYKKILQFVEPVTIKYAIKQVEKFLSKKLTQHYYKKVKDDLFHNDMKWEYAESFYKCRGDVLTCAVYLEKCYVQNGILTFYIGS
jgi:hypothetical protein